MTTKLQKRDIDIIEAYSMIDSTKRKIKDLRSNIEEEHKEWFKEAEEVASQVGVDINMPRIAGRQQHRANASDTNVIDYYRDNYSSKFVDHLLAEFEQRFSNENQVGVKLLHLLPAHILTRTNTDLDVIVRDLAFWESDLTHPIALKNEIKDWNAKWSDNRGDNVPTNLLEALEQCDQDVYPCIHKLLIIGCTLPVTSCEAERSFSALRRTMTHVRSSMGEE